MALFSLLGTRYGGDGLTTFALPDLRGRVPVGHGTGPGLRNWQIGERQGAENVTLTAQQLPPHQHTVNVPYSEADATQNVAAPDVYPARTEALGYAPPVAGESHVLVSTPTGAAEPVLNFQPTLGLSYIICLYGIFPQRP